MIAGVGQLPGEVPAEVPAVSTPVVDWWAVGPVLVLAAGALVLLTADSLWRGRRVPGFYAIWTCLVAGIAGVCTIPLWFRVTDSAEGPFTTVGGAVGVDGFGLFLVGVICCSVVLTALLADGYLRREGLEGPTLYTLMLLAAAGGSIMAMADDLVVLFLGLETLSIAAYVLAALQLRRASSQEAGMKYFVLGAFSSAFFLYGMAMVYGAAGSTNLIQIRDYLTRNVLGSESLLMLGTVLMLVGLGFKVAAVPFHSWAPDVYDGSPSPVVAFMASGIKAAGFAALVRVYDLTLVNQREDWQPLMYALAVLSLFAGSAIAVVQSNVKRMLAYSSIAHAGFMLVGVQAATQNGTSAVLFYLGAYTFLVAGSFGVVTIVEGRGERNHDITGYQGLGRSSPLVAGAFTLLLLAQAGVPLTSGFLAKFYVISAAVEVRSYWLAIAAMVSAVIAAFVYLRIVVAMWMPAGDGADVGEDAGAGARTRTGEQRVPVAAGIVLGVCAAVTVAFGVWPQPAVDWAERGVPALVQGSDGAPQPGPVLVPNGGLDG